MTSPVAWDPSHVEAELHLLRFRPVVRGKRAPRRPRSLGVDPWRRPPFWAADPRPSAATRIAAAANRDRELLEQLAAARALELAARPAHRAPDLHARAEREVRRLEAELGLTARSRGDGAP
jgi:hypothetical protein